MEIRASHAHILERNVSFASFPLQFAIYPTPVIAGYVLHSVGCSEEHRFLRKAGLIPGLFCHLLNVWGLVTYRTSQDLVLIIIKVEITVPFSKVTEILKTCF